MNRKIFILLLLVPLISILVVQPAFAAKSYYAEFFDVQIDLQEGGSAVITETVKFHFEGDPFTFAFREISARETDGLTFLEASMDGVAMPEGTQAGQVEVEGGDPLRVTWHFAPTSDAAHVFTIRYRATGVVRKGDADTLIWRAVPEDHEYSIERSTVMVTYPPMAALLEPPSLNRRFEAVADENRVLLTTSGLAEDEDLALTARFAPGSLAQAAPQWQTRQEQANAAAARAIPVGLATAVATLILGGLGLLTYIRANSRELAIGPVVPSPNPPSDLSPAIIGKLTKQPHAFMGAIFDLAQRGVLEVREETGQWGTKKHVLVHRDHSIALSPFERGLLDALFKPGEKQINLNEVASRLAAKHELFDEPLEQELIQRGWLDPDRKQKRIWLAGFGWISLFLALTLFVAALLLGAAQYQNMQLAVVFAGLTGVSLGLFILSVALLIYAGTLSVLTPAGEEQAVRWKGFAEYLKQVGKGREPAIRPDTFERYLSYAAVFGLGANWAKYFQELGNVPLPVWFHGMKGNESNFAAIVAVMAASDSSGAGGGGGAGSAGVSGGGSSGAG
jgi:hypothetical protein